MMKEIWRQLSFKVNSNGDSEPTDLGYFHLSIGYNLWYIFYELSFFLQANMTPRIRIIAHELNYHISNFLLPNTFNMTRMT